MKPKRVGEEWEDSFGHKFACISSPLLKKLIRYAPFFYNLE